MGSEVLSILVKVYPAFTSAVLGLLHTIDHYGINDLIVACVKNKCSVFFFNISHAVVERPS